MKPRQIVGIVCVIALIIAGLWSINHAVYHQNANEIVVTQSIGGDLQVSFSPGIHSLMGGQVTRYPRRGQVEFDDQGSASEGVYKVPPLGIMFNDGASCKLQGAISWEMPNTPEQVIKLHKEYGSAVAIEQQLLKKTLEKSVFMTGPLMSSAESYASRRNELLNDVADQVENGVYKTESHDATTTDPLTGQVKSIRQVDIVTDSHGVISREDESPVKDFGVHTFGLTIHSVDYPDAVVAQITSQQQAIMAVQTAIAKAKTAEQDALTIEQQGKANAAQAKWEQEAEKAKQVTIAQKNLEVATLTAMADQTNAVIAAQKQVEVAELGTQAADYDKQSAILRGQGDAQAAQLRMQANGALEQKLAAYVQVNQAYADAISKYTGNWVPQTVFGGSEAGSASAGNGASTLVDLLTAKTARDLNLDMTTAVQHPAVR